MTWSVQSSSGIGVYGVANESGKISFFTVATHEILGYFNITNVKSTSTCSMFPHGASLQLNSVVLTRTTENNFSFWIQNVLLFNTSDNAIKVLDNVWNFSSQYSTLNASGKGEILNSNEGSYYVFSEPWELIKFPFAGYLLEKETRNEAHLTVSFGYVIIQNGSFVPPSVVWYDNVSIPVLNSTSSCILVSPRETPQGSLFDAELVFGGPGSGSQSCFSALNASLGLFYNNTHVVPFKSIYDFGTDTAERSLDVHAYLNGLVDLYAGEENPSFLTDNYSFVTPFTAVEIENVVNHEIISKELIYIDSAFRENLTNITNASVDLVPENLSVSVQPSDVFQTKTIFITYEEIVEVSLNLPNGTTHVWVKKGDSIRLPETILEGTTRYSLEGNDMLKICSPINLTPVYQKQFLVKLITMQGAQTFWVRDGSKIRLYQESLLPTQWIGTYDVKNGFYVTVNQPIVEREVVSGSPYYIVAGIVILILLTVLARRRRRSS
nr:thermopsin family protease [Sulfuracidifex tepidarius]